MKSHATTMTIFVGVDVSKASLDIYRPDTLERIKINNSETSVADFCQQLQKKKRSLMVVMEATGGYETLLVNQLALHDLKAAVVNPRRVRDFAKGIGIDAKTDPIDAKVLSRYGEVVSPKPKASKSEHEQKHGALVARRNQLLELINQEKNRLGQSWDEDARQSIREVLEMLKKQLKNIDSQLAKMLKADSMNPRKIEILLSAKRRWPCDDFNTRRQNWQESLRSIVIPAGNPESDSLVEDAARFGVFSTWPRSLRSAITRRSRRSINT